MWSTIFNSFPCTGVGEDLTGPEVQIIARLLHEYEEREIPVLPAFHKPVDTMIRTREGERGPHPGVWCVDCDDWHEHGPDFGHRVAHCHNPRSRYYRRGYVIAYAGQWRDCFKRRSLAMRRYCPSCPDPHPCRREIPKDDPDGPGEHRER